MLDRNDFERQINVEEDTGELMNRFEGPGTAEAKIKYLDGDFQILSAGTFVSCAVTGVAIPLDELKYWSVEKQEAYVDVIASVKASQTQ